MNAALAGGFLRRKCQKQKLLQGKKTSVLVRIPTVASPSTTGRELIPALTIN